MNHKELLSSDSSSDNEGDGGAQLDNGDFKINESYARRFEYNKKREELQQLEEKHGQASRKRKRDPEEDGQGVDGSHSDDSTSESEDEGDLATEALDSEIIATLTAIRSKDPRIYDKEAKFYTKLEIPETAIPDKSKKDKPMNLQDYHRKNLLNGSNGATEEENHPPPLTYNQEQEQMKRTILQEINDAVQTSSDVEISDQEEKSENKGFLIAKVKPKPRPKEPLLDVENADRDPEMFLSNFMASRAWAAPQDRNLVPFESDDEDEDRRADEFEEAYNFRFEDPQKSNEKLRSYARDTEAKFSVRRGEENPRQKKRELEKAKKELAKQEQREEKARLRKLKIEEAEEKIRRIKKAAGLKSKDLKPEDWSRFVSDDWDDAKWEEEMQIRFGDDYYAEQDDDSGDERPPRKAKKPKFEDDLDIKDIVPDFVDEEPADFSLSDDEGTAPKNHKKRKEEKKREAKRERRIIEQIVDDQLQHELDHAVPSASRTKGFRYRDTSPKSFGLSAVDILMADDSQLNEFAGLKKLAAFRDPQKKQKDQKHLGKKARLRKWRQDTFGREDGIPASALVPAEDPAVGEMNGDGEEVAVDIISGGKKKRRRNKKHKTGVTV